MILSLAKFLIARNPALTLAHARRLVKLGLIALWLLATVIGYFAWKHAVIAAHDAKRDRADLQTALDRTQAADTAGDVRDGARAEAAEQSRTAMEKAEADDPEAAQAPAGPVTRAAAHRLPVRR